MKIDSEIVILGAGLSGLAAARRLEHECSVAVFEGESKVGGHASSHTHGAFTFDNGPHVSFTKNEPIRHLLADSVHGRFHDHRTHPLNRWQDIWLPHPVQSNLFKLPEDLKARCVRDIEAAQRCPARAPDSYRDWCLQNLGDAICNEFVFPYTLKYWTADASELTTDWIGTRVHAPDLDEVREGASREVAPRGHYLTSFRYPEAGGFGAYADGLQGSIPVHLSHRAVRIDSSRRQIEFENGTTARYERLVSSLPLPELIRLMTDVPHEVQVAAEHLVCTSVVLHEFGFRDGSMLPPAHWVYFYGDAYPFARMHFPHKLSASNAPAGFASLQTETYFSRYRPRPERTSVDEVLSTVVAAGLVGSAADVVLAEEHTIRYANVLFDHRRAPSLATIGDYLDSAGIARCGRYGEWAYYWSDDSILSGFRAAERALESLRGSDSEALRRAGGAG